MQMFQVSLGKSRPYPMAASKMHHCIVYAYLITCHLLGEQCEKHSTVCNTDYCDTVFNFFWKILPDWIGQRNKMYGKLLLLKLY